MTSEVWAGLTNRAIERAQDAGQEKSNDPGLDALTALFTSDPVVSLEDGRYILRSVELEDAYHDGATVSELERIAWAIVGRINGAATVAGHRLLHPVRVTSVVTPTRQGTYARLHSVLVYAHPPITDSERTRATLITAAGRHDAHLEQVLKLLGNLQSEWIWIDLWRIWDALRRHAGGKAVFPQWLKDPQAKLDFERSANDPEVSGMKARHMDWQPPKSAKDPVTDEPLGRSMPEGEAIEFISRLVQRWVDDVVQRESVPNLRSPS